MNFNKLVFKKRIYIRTRAKRAKRPKRSKRSNNISSNITTVSQMDSESIKSIIKEEENACGLLYKKILDEEIHTVEQGFLKAISQESIKTTNAESAYKKALLEAKVREDELVLKISSEATRATNAESANILSIKANTINIEKLLKTDLLNNSTNNTRNGNKCLISNTTGNWNTANGCMAAEKNTIGNGNTSMGNGSLSSNTIGNNNTAVGNWSIGSNISGNNNTSVGLWSMSENKTGSNNTAVGLSSGPTMDNLINTTSIGNGAEVTQSNTIRLGNEEITNVSTSGSLTTGAITFPSIAGKKGQVLMTDGLGNASWVDIKTLL